ncbi:hypothetical protein [Microcoleus sp. BROC3]|uniref:hypothetical protein n=1 Tax=Microcoleus sp. BROC3 TaxID=3055323 RepID=UPI002FD79053
MKNPFSQARILGAVVLVLVLGSLLLAGIDLSTRPMFGDLTKVVVGAYIGLYIPAPNQRLRLGSTVPLGWDIAVSYPRS